MPDDPVIRWENEGGAILLGNGAKRHAPRDEGEAEVSDVAHLTDRHAEARAECDGSTPPVDQMVDSTAPHRGPTRLAATDRHRLKESDSPAPGTNARRSGVHGTRP